MVQFHGCGLFFVVVFFSLFVCFLYIFESQLPYLIIFSSLLSPSVTINGVDLFHTIQLEDGNSGFIYRDDEIMGHPPSKRRILMHMDCQVSLSAFHMGACSSGIKSLCYRSISLFSDSAVT